MTDTPETPETPASSTPPTPPTPPAPRALTEGPNAAPTPPPTETPVATSQQANSGASFRRSRPALIVAALAVGALVGGAAGGGIVLALNNGNSGSSVQGTTTPANITVNNPDKATTVTAVAAKASASVVTISATSSDAGGTGSGVILTDDGYVLTNTHVVTLDGATSDATIKVQTNDGRLFNAKVVGTDPVSDLAVIKIEGVSDLTPAKFADSGKLNVGDTAIAIGAPLGLSGTVTDGIVSAINRSITIASSAPRSETQAPEDSTTPEDSPFDFWIPGPDDSATPPPTSSTISLAVLQTDAAINPGNSGGALLNADGEVIGINVAIASAGGTSAASQSGSIGVGFAIPANLAKRVSDEIIENGSATHGLLGASIVDVTEDTAQTDSATVGASVKEVVPGGAADKAGLKVGDIITGIDGLPVTGKTDLTAQVRALAGGAETTVTYVRGGKSANVDLTLGTLE